MPTLAWAQGSVAGVVRDPSGAVLPGVVVSATSSALIERSRTALTDGAGLYRITELPPGAYALSFSLAGFTTLHVEDVEVRGAAVATVDVELSLGTLEETISVRARPTVDVQSARRQVVLDSDTIQSLPATRAYGALLNGVPSLQGGLFATQIRQQIVHFNAYGGRPNEGRLQLDGFNVGTAFNGGGVSGFSYDTANAAEIQVTLSGGLGEAEVGSAHMNMVPRSGGNTFSATGFFSQAGEWSQGENLDDELRAFLSDPPGIVRNWDVSGAVGGPILRDRLWFFGNVRTFGDYSSLAGRYANANAGDASRWDYLEDRTVTARDSISWQVYSLRLTGQARGRHRVGLSVDQQFVCMGSATSLDGEGCRPRGTDWIASGASNVSPESGGSGYENNLPERIIQATWMWPATNRLLLDAGVSIYTARWGWNAPPGGLTHLTPVTEITTVGTGVPVPNFTYRGLDNYFDNSHSPTHWRASVAYVTGAHNVKVGYQGHYHIEKTYDFANDTQLTYSFTGGTPTSFGFRIAPWQTSNRTVSHAAFAQDQWTVGRITLQGAVRYDHAYSFFPASENGAPFPSRFNAAPINPIQMLAPGADRLDGVKGYHDVTPRLGAAWDLFGTGRTALRVSLGKYLQAATNQLEYSTGNPAMDGRNGRVASFVTATTRTWTDANSNRTPDCVLTNPLPQDLRSQGGDLCGQWGNLNFGNMASPQEVNPAVLQGWGVRPYDWYAGVSVQQEVVPRVTVEAGYNRRWYGNFFVLDNRNLSPVDFTPWTYVAPLHPELPGGGGYDITSYMITQAAFQRLASNYYTFETDFGPARTQYWHGVDVTLTARPRAGVMIQGGTSTGRGVRNRCETVTKIDSPDPRNCAVTEPWITSFRGLASVTIPVVDVQASAIVRFQTTQAGAAVLATAQSASNGNSLNANHAIPNTVVAQLLGRPVPTPGATTTINLLETGELFPDQLRTVDVRFTKLVRVGRSRTDIGVDIYNIFNSNHPTGYVQAFDYLSNGATWLRPTSILGARFVRLNATLQF